MKKIFLLLVLVIGFGLQPAFANPGDYKLRILAGPSFNANDWVDQFSFGGEFNYDLGYSMNIDLTSLFGVGNDAFRFQLIPGFSYNFLYIGPAAFHALTGIGYGLYESDSALDVRFSTGVSLPLGDSFEAYTDINYVFAPVGTPGTPATFDWLLGFGFNFN